MNMEKKKFEKGTFGIMVKWLSNNCPVIKYKWTPCLQKCHLTLHKIYIKLQREVMAKQK